MAELHRKIRYALVGAGNLAQVAVLPAFGHASANSELVAVVSPDERKRQELGQRYGLHHVGPYEEFERLADESGAEAVYVAVPSQLHAEWTKRAAKKGLHVLCEKPMAPTVADCEAMIGAARTADVKLMIAYRLHFEEANLGAIEVVRSGRIGNPRLFAASLTQQVRAGDVRTRADEGGGALLDLGLYCVNAARYVFVDEPIEVFAWSNAGDDPRAQGVDETTVALLRFHGGRIAQLAVSQAAAGTTQFRIVGSEGDLIVEPAFDSVGPRKHFLTVNDRTTETTFPARDQFAPELLYFSQCILDGAEPEPSGEEGLADVRVLVALQESARTGRPVALPAFARARRPDPSQAIARPSEEAPPPVDAAPPTGE
jgi:predicted dehydrogenase